MGRPTTLRIPEGIELTSELIEYIVDLIGAYGEPVIYHAENDVKDSTIERMSSLKDAFTFMLGAKGSEREELVSFAQVALKKLSGEITNDTSAKKILGQYAQILIDILCLECNLIPKEALEQLNRAEQYYMLTQQRPNIATISSLPTKDDVFLIQHDMPIQAFTEKTIDELKLIKKYARDIHIKERNTDPIPAFPEWFNDIHPFVKTFVFNAKAQGMNDSEIRQSINILRSSWNECSKYMDKYTIESIKKYALSNDPVLLPTWLQKLPEVSRQLIADYFTKSIYSPPRDLDLITTKLIPDTKGLPAWYFFLKEYERVFLVKSLDLIKDLTSVTLSSRLRSLPGIANAALHGIKIVDINGNVLESFDDRKRGAHLVSRDNKNWPLSIQGEFVRRNLSLLADEEKLYITTLISPSNSSLGLAISEYHPDTWLHNVLETVVSTNANWKLLNFPVNYYGGMLIPWPENLAPFIESLLKKSEEDEVDPELEDLQPLIKEAHDLLEKKVDSVEWNSVNLRLAAIVHLIGQRKGVSFGSCVSGKDRYAVLLAYTDAMKVYKYCFGTWPGFHNSKNVLFNRLFMGLLKTGHQPKIAELNANGSKGLKNLHDYLTDIIETEDTQWVKEQDQMASTNELKVICRAYGYEQGMGERLFRCIALGEAKCRLINDQIHAIVQENGFWQSVSTHGSPDGIGNIRNLFTARPSSPSQSSYFSSLNFIASWGSFSSKVKQLEPPYLSRCPFLVLADVLNEVSRAGKRYSYSRDERTQKFYNILSNIEKMDADTLSSADFASELEDFFKDIKEKTTSKNLH